MKEQSHEPGSTPKPSLTEYGSIAKLTQGTATKQSDGKAGGFLMTCL